jgi:hypothetical protein
MKRLLAALTLLFGLVVVAGVANATHSTEANSPGPPKDFAVGGGKHTSAGTQFAFSAHSGPLGEDPKGHIQLFFPQGVIKAEVTCLIVDGNEAFITGVSDELPGGTTVTHAVDNGEPGDPTPDLMRGSFLPFITPVDGQPGCFLPQLPPVPVTEGNIVVHDGQPKSAEAGALPSQQEALQGTEPQGTDASAPASTSANAPASASTGAAAADATASAQ